MCKKQGIKMPPKGLFFLLLAFFILSLGKVSAVSACTGDLNNDGFVDGGDFALFLADWGNTDCSETTPCAGDLNNDGFVDGGDFALFSS